MNKVLAAGAGALLLLFCGCTRSAGPAVPEPPVSGHGDAVSGGAAMDSGTSGAAPFSSSKALLSAYSAAQSAAAVSRLGNSQRPGSSQFSRSGGVTMQTASSTVSTAKQGLFKPDDWELVWNDEFNGSSLDFSKWSCERGFVRNKEPQAYTTRPENVRLENGDLILEARKETYSGSDAIINDYGNYPASEIGQRKTAYYTSGSIVTQGKFSTEYGRIEMRAKLPQGRAMWPAFWTMGPNPVVGGVTKYWPFCGEIDILEAYGNNQYEYQSQLHWADAAGQHASLYMPQYGGKTPAFKPGGASRTIDSDYHVYGLLWDAQSISFYCDDTIFYTRSITDPAMDPEFHSKHYLLLNLALLQDTAALDATVFPLTYSVDYVRVFQHK